MINRTPSNSLNLRMMFFGCLMLIPLSLVNAEYSRSKRIINGDPILNWGTGYDAMRYLASIGTTHGFGYIGMKFGNVYFSGAFITPGIVQTACHCLCEGEDRDDKNPGALKIKQRWENILNVYMGAYERFAGDFSVVKTKPIKSKRFIIHQACAILPNDTKWTYTSDYGWITLESGWDPKIEPYLTRIDFAPQYSVSQLLKMWNYLSARRSVCLHMGLGRYRRDKTYNNELRAGWRTLLPYSKCVELTSENLTSIDLLTWSCLIPFPNHEQSIDFAEVGTPLTCNNFYFGVASGWRDTLRHKEDLELMDFVSFVFDSPLAFALFENALDWRSAFISYIENQGKKPICEFVCDMTTDPRLVVETYKPLREKRFEHERC